MPRLLVHPAPIELRKGSEDLPVFIYGSRNQSPSGYSIGNRIPERIARLGIPIPDEAFDLVTVALAVTAADTFVDRRQTDDGWTRPLELAISVSNPSVWELVRATLQEALNFLTGDMWTLSFRAGGRPAPVPFSASHGRRLITLSGADSVCLFSGGLDSTVGVLDLLAQGCRPLLVSHAYRGDRQTQQFVSERLPSGLPRFSFNANPFSPTANDVTMRSRSLNFIALGVLCACAVARVNRSGAARLVIPENGLISINPPLTPRRIGALSTRTTHPYFIALMQEVVRKIGLEVELLNPYQFATKGEMLASCRQQEKLREIAPFTVSCGKWKRSGQQCGRCVPCLIRRAAFWAAELKDRTRPSYREADLLEVMRSENLRDDVLAMALATRQLNGAFADADSVVRWVALAGPLPSDSSARRAYADVVRRGLQEVRSFLVHSGIHHD